MDRAAWPCSHDPAICADSQVTRSLARRHRFGIGRLRTAYPTWGAGGRVRRRL